MDLNAIRENEKKWRHFVSDVKPRWNRSTKNVQIQKKTTTDCLVNDFANQLLVKKGGKVSVYGPKYAIEKVQDALAVKTPSPKTSLSSFPESKRENTWPTIKRGNISNGNDTFSQAKETVKKDLFSNFEKLESSNDEKGVTEDNFEQAQTLQDDFVILDEDNDAVLKNAEEQTKAPTEQFKSNETEAVQRDAFKNVEERQMHGDDDANKIENEFVDYGTAGSEAKKMLDFNEDNVNNKKNCLVGLRKADTVKITASDFDEVAILDDDANKSSSKTKESNVFTDIADFHRKRKISVPVGITIASNKSDERFIIDGSPINGTGYINDECVELADDFSTPTKVKRLDFSNENGSQSNEKGRFDFQASDIKHITDNIEINRSRDRDYRPISRKSDIDMACSKWKISNIAEYFDFDKCVRSMDLSFSRNTISEMDIFVVQKDISRLIGVLQRTTSPMKTKSKSIDTFGSSLKATTINETGTRLVIDAFLIPLCSMLNLTIGVDINVNCTYLPNCRFDYCIYKDDKIVGCVEAKSPRALDESSIAQAIIQLNILQALRISKEDEKSDDRNLPIFCIITDGSRFIFIQIIGNFLYFQIDEGSKKLKINEILKEGEIPEVLSNMTSLIVDSSKGDWVYDKDCSIVEEKEEILSKIGRFENEGSSSQSPIYIE